MPDNKLKDNEIKKALEGAILNAKKCDSKVWSIEVYKLENALDLINSLQAKVIKEQNKNSKLRNERNHLQAKAYKECIEKVKERLAVYSFTSNSTEYDNGVLDCMEWVDSKIEELKKELVSDDNA